MYPNSPETKIFPIIAKPKTIIVTNLRVLNFPNLRVQGVLEKFVDEGNMEALIVALNDSATSKTSVSVDNKSSLQISSSEIFFAFENHSVTIREGPESSPLFNGPFKSIKMEDKSAKTNFSSYVKIDDDGKQISQKFPAVIPKNIILEEFTFPFTPPKPTGNGHVDGTIVYSSDTDFEALKGQQLEEEKIYGTLKVLHPSHASGDEMGDQNHKVTELGEKVLQGNQVRDYYNLDPVKAVIPNLQIQLYANLDDTTDNLSLKFGNHSLKGFEFGGYGVSFHPKENNVQSKVEFNHPPEGSPNEGSNNEKSEQAFKLKDTIQRNKYVGYRATIQTVKGKREKVLNAWIDFGGNGTFKQVVANRKWDDKVFKDNKIIEGGNNDTEELKKGIYLSGLHRIWIRCNGVSKKSKILYKNVKISTLEEA